MLTAFVRRSLCLVASRLVSVEIISRRQPLLDEHDQCEWIECRYRKLREGLLEVFVNSLLVRTHDGVAEEISNHQLHGSDAWAQVRPRGRGN